MKKNIFTAVLALVLLSSSALLAQRGSGNCAECPNMTDKLNLSEDQLMQIQDLKTQHQKQVLDFKNEIAKNRLQMKQLLAAQTLNEESILALTDANSKVQAEMKRAAVKHKFAVYNLLDDKQKEVFAKTFEKMGARTQQMKAKRGGKNFGARGKHMRQRFNR